MSQVSFDDFCFCSRRLSVDTFLSLSMMKTILGNNLEPAAQGKFQLTK